MSKSITVDESVYNQLKEWAEKDHRSISKELEFMVDSILNRRLVFTDHITGQQPVIQQQPTQPSQESYQLSPEIPQGSMSTRQFTQEELDELDRMYEEAMKKPKPVLNGGFLTPEEIEKYSGQNIIVDDD